MHDFDPYLAKRYLAYLRKKPWTRKALCVVGPKDALQNIWLAWLEFGRPQGKSINREVLMRAWNYIAMQYYRLGRELLDCQPDNRPMPADVRTMAWLGQVLDHYEAHTADQTIAAFHLPDNARVRRWLGRCVPKHQRAGGKRYREIRSKVYTTATCAELVAIGVPRATAWRAAKRGHYWQKTGADRKTGPKAFAPRR